MHRSDCLYPGIGVRIPVTLNIKVVLHWRLFWKAILPECLGEFSLCLGCCLIPVPQSCSNFFFLFCVMFYNIHLFCKLATKILIRLRKHTSWNWHTQHTSHYENTPIQIYRKFRLQKLKSFRQKNSDIFHISAQNIDCGYSLEPPRRGSSNEYPQFIF